MLDKKHMLVAKENDDMRDESLNFTRRLSGHLQDTELMQKVAALQSQIFPSCEGIMVKYLLDSGDSEAALAKFEELAKETKSLHFLPSLVQEFTIQEDKVRMQRLLDATVIVQREEGALYSFARIFLEMGRTSQARTLMQAPGLRYNDSTVKGICNRLEKKSPTALEEFVKLCIPLFASDQNFLFEKLVDCVSNDPEKIEDIWVSMQEANFIPDDSLMRKLAGILKSHGLEVPFQIEDEPEPEHKPEQKTLEPTQKQKPEPKKQTSEAEPKQKQKPKSDEGNELKGKEKAEVIHNFNSEIAKQDVGGAVTILLQALKKKQATHEMASDTIQLMITKEDFSQLEEICESISTAARGFRRVFRHSLDSVPLEIVQNLNLSPKVQKDLFWPTYVTSRVSKNCSDLQSLFDQIKTEDFGLLRPNSMAHLITNQDSAKIIVDKVSETKDIVQNMNLDPSLLGSFSANAFILLAIKGQDSSALQLYKDFEKDLNVSFLRNYSNIKTEASQQSKEIFNNFLKKNGINLEEKK